MNNFFTYVINLRDQMSGTLRRVGGSIADVSDKVRRLRSDVRNLNAEPLSGLRNSFSNVLKSIPFSQYIFNPFTIAGVTAGRALKIGIDQEMRNASFEVLFKGEENAKKMIDSISAYAAKTPYGKAELSDAVQVMAGFGLQTENILPNLRAIGDIAMGDKSKLSSLTLAFSQMSATGKLMGQDLLQMINAGFNPLEQMAKTTGKSIGTLKEEMSKGLVTSQMVTQAFYDATSAGGLFYGMTDKISNTLGGQLSTLMDNFDAALLKLYDVIQPYLIPAIKALNLLLTDTGAFIDKAIAKIESWWSANKILGTSIIAITAAIIGYRVAMLSLSGIQLIILGIQKALVAYEIVVFAVKNATSLWAAAQWLLNVALNANPIGLIVAGVVALIAVIAFLIVKIDGWGNAWQHTVNGSKLIFKAYVDSVKYYFNTMLNGLMIGLNKIQEGWYRFKETVGIGDSSQNREMLAQIQADTDRRKKEITDGAKSIVETSLQAVEEFKKAGQSFSINDTSLADVANGLKSKLGISTAGVPGMESAGGLAGTGGTGGTGGKGAASGSAVNSIATGGSKTTHITLNLGDLVKTMNVYCSDMKEGGQKIREIIQDELTRALLMVQANV